MRSGTWVACSVGALVALLVTSACSSSGGKRTQGAVTTVIVTASPSKPSTTPTVTASQKPMRKLSGTCDTELPSIDVAGALGVPLTGRTEFVVGVAEKNIGRLGYINCRYGLGAAKTAAPKIELGVSLYATPTQASRRLTGTISDYVDHGATREPATVSGLEGTLLVGGSAPGYDVPLLVVASGQRTVAVSVVSSLLPAAERGIAMAKVASLALERTGG